MSRHEIESFAKRYEVAVGWDRPLNTYFAQVKDLEDTDEDSDPLIVWVGTSYSEILRPEDLQSHIAPFATIARVTLKALRKDRAHTLDKGNSPLQRAMRGIAERN
jgi:hypothetical protein